MDKENKITQKMYEALCKKYEAEMAEAESSLLVYFTSPVGIGEHPQHIEEMDKKFIASSKKINNLIDENFKINQKVTDINEKTDKKINEIKTAADNKGKLLNDLSSPEKIKAFQATQGLPQTGKIGPRTRRAILLLKK